MKDNEFYNPDELVTKGYLDERFSRQDETMSGMFGLVMEKLDLIRHEMDEYRQETQAVSRTQVMHERMIDGLDQRVLKLETKK